MNKCILNVACGAWYPRGQQRLIDSLQGQDVGQMMWADSYPEGSPPHNVVPYAFKIYAIRAAQKAGYRYLLWADAAVWAIKPVEPIFETIAKNGYLFFVNTWSNLGEWSSDACLDGFGISRDDAMKMYNLMACCMGFDLEHPISIEFLNRWQAKAEDGFSFHGSWTNANHEVSQDERVKGHRHDQTVASIIAHQMGLGLTVGHETFFQYYYGNMEEIGPLVCLLTQGM